MPGTSGRRGWNIEQRRDFALRLYRCIRLRFQEERPRRKSAFEWFIGLLKAPGIGTRESTVRNWIPPRSLLDLDPDRGSAVRMRDWKALRTPDLAQLCEVADLLDVSVDYLRGRDVPMRCTDREPPGELASALRAHVIARIALLPDWDSHDTAVATRKLPVGSELLATATSLMLESIASDVKDARAERLRAMLSAAETLKGARSRTDSLIRKAYLEGPSPDFIREIARLRSGPSVAQTRMKKPSNRPPVTSNS